MIEKCMEHVHIHTHAHTQHTCKNTGQGYTYKSKHKCTFSYTINWSAYLYPKNIFFDIFKYQNSCSS